MNGLILVCVAVCVCYGYVCVDMGRELISSSNQRVGGKFKTKVVCQTGQARVLTTKVKADVPMTSFAYCQCHCPYSLQLVLA